MAGMAPKKPLDPVTAREAHREKIHPLMKAAARENKAQEEARHGQKWSLKVSAQETRRAELAKIMTKLEQVRVAIAKGKTIEVACKEADITEHTYKRWYREYSPFRGLAN